MSRGDAERGLGVRGGGSLGDSGRVATHSGSEVTEEPSSSGTRAPQAPCADRCLLRRRQALLKCPWRPATPTEYRDGGPGFSSASVAEGNRAGLATFCDRPTPLGTCISFKFFLLSEAYFRLLKSELPVDKMQSQLGTGGKLCARRSGTPAPPSPGAEAPRAPPVAVGSSAARARAGTHSPHGWERDDPAVARRPS